MAAEYSASLDIALATEARAMFGRLLSAEDKKRIAALSDPEELIAYLRRTPGWGAAARRLPAEDVSDRQFSLEIERGVYSEYERLYRFAESTAKDFLIFIALRVECRAILAALRRLLTPGALTDEDILPPFFHVLTGCDAEKLTTAANYDQLAQACSKGIYGETLKNISRDPDTGLPSFAEAADLLDDRYYAALTEFLSSGYRGGDKRQLTDIVAFRAELLNISYLLRLRRFHTPPEKARELLLPIGGGLGRRVEDAVLSAATDREAVEIIRASRRDKKHFGIIPEEPEKFVRAAEAAYFRKIIRGAPSLSVVYAFMVVKEAEGDMLRRVFVALQYGVDPGIYM